VRIRCRGYVFTEPLPSNGRFFSLWTSSFQPGCHNIFIIQYSIAT
jgi:hypothetical protein